MRERYAVPRRLDSVPDFCGGCGQRPPRWDEDGCPSLSLFCRARGAQGLEALLMSFCGGWQQRASNVCGGVQSGSAFALVFRLSAISYTSANMLSSECLIIVHYQSSMLMICFQQIA